MSTATVASPLDLWKTPGFPHRGWECIDVVDLNPDELPSDEVDYETCQACGQHPIRFVHTLEHDRWAGRIEVGCVCSEKLTGDYVNPKRHEADLRRRAATRARWLTRKWRRSARGNAWMKVRGRHIVVFPSRSSGGFCYSVDGQFGRRTFPDERSAQLASYDAFEDLNRREASDQ